METNTTQKISLQDVLIVLFRYKFFVIMIFILTISSIVFQDELKTPKYSATVKMLVTGVMPSDLQYVRTLGPGSLIANHMKMVKSELVIKRVVESQKLYNRPFDYEKKYSSRLKAFLIERSMEKMRTKLESMTPEGKHEFLYSRAMEKLSSNIVTDRDDPDTSLFVITVRDFDRAQAIKLANVVSRSYMIFDLENQIAELQLVYGEKNVTIQKLRNYIDKMEDSLDGRLLTSTEALGPASVKIISQAHGASLISKRQGKIRIIVIAFILSLFFGLVISYGIDYINPTIKSTRDVLETLKVPLLGSIPKRKKEDHLIMKDADITSDLYCIQAFQSVGDRIHVIMKEKKIKSFLVTDSDVMDDTSAIIANLAYYFSSNIGKKVLVIDANLRNPSVSRVFHVSETPGLVELFEGKTTLDDAISNPAHNLYVLATKKALFSPINLIDSSFFIELFKKSSDQFDIIFVICNSGLRFSDYVILSPLLESTLFVLNEGKSKYRDVMTAIDILKQKKINNIYAILNDRKYPLPNIIYKVT
jgi:Mrp family chromosome partitioning ATPase